MTAEEVAQRFPDAVSLARALRDVFGEARLRYARNAQGDALGAPLERRTQISAELWRRIMADLERRR
jgi:hypothetical protein